MNSHFAARVGLAARRLKGHSSRTTALTILDDGYTRRAGMRFFTDRTIGHAVVAFNLLVLVCRDMQLVDGHGVLFTTADGGLIVKIGGDVLGLRGSTGKSVSFACRSGAVEAFEFICAVGGE